MATTMRADDFTACDRLAGNPEDPQKVGPGVPFFSMDGGAAAAACDSAAQEHPEIVRFKYQLGLALARNKRYQEAFVPIREAAAAGYAPAEADLAYAITNFGSPPQDYGEAFRNVAPAIFHPGDVRGSVACFGWPWQPFLSTAPGVALAFAATNTIQMAMSAVFMTGVPPLVGSVDVDTNP